MNEALGDFGSEHSFDKAADTFKRHYHFKISDSTIRRITAATSKNAEQFIHSKFDQFEKAYEEQTSTVAPLKTLFLGMDGCSIRTGTLFETTKKRQKNEKTRLGIAMKGKIEV